MKKLILVRHGQSEWNLKNLFTGWTDVDLTEQGIEEALKAGKTIKEEGLKPEICFTSYLKRAIKTLNNILDAMDMDYYDMIITDIMMPVMDGYELVRQLREAGNTTPVLMITAKDAFDDMRLGFQSGVDDYMVKPINVNEM
ncbi:MAG: 2,3-bisphosphoglycerate-dependent phosphoglycerate mutase, partial [Bacteroidales bacterium]|nr:2,3-bisphosphoglycerate-dependent phosphoglycerate mutase [Bacteroidales bacterium]